MMETRKPKKKFGQHWLKDESILDEIIKNANLKKNDFLLEVGPGKGALTSKLLNEDIRGLHAVEIDRDLIQQLNDRFKSNSKFSLQEADILNTKIETPNNIRITKVVANIPYYITSPILELFVGKLGKININSYEIIIFMMQKEIADRIVSKAGNRNFSALSIRMQLLAKIKKIKDVSPKSFYPMPKVMSSLVAFTPKKLNERLSMKNEIEINTLLKVCFSQRRKKLKNTLISYLSSDTFNVLRNSSVIDLNLRPQDLDILSWLELSTYINSICNESD